MESAPLDIRSATTAPAAFEALPDDLFDLEATCVECRACGTRTWLDLVGERCPGCEAQLAAGEPPLDFVLLVPPLGPTTAASIASRAGWMSGLWMHGAGTPDYAAPTMNEPLSRVGFSHEEGDPLRSPVASWALASAFVGLGCAPPISCVQIITSHEAWFDDFVDRHPRCGRSELTIVHGVLATIDEVQRSGPDHSKWSDTTSDALRAATNPVLRERLTTLATALEEGLDRHRDVTRSLVAATGDSDLALLMRSAEIMGVGKPLDLATARTKATTYDHPRYEEPASLHPATLAGLILIAVGSIAAGANGEDTSGAGDVIGGLMTIVGILAVRGGALGFVGALIFAGATYGITVALVGS